MTTVLMPAGIVMGREKRHVRSLRVGSAVISTSSERILTWMDGICEFTSVVIYSAFLFSAC